jgi:hypothetical protein
MAALLIILHVLAPARPSPLECFTLREATLVRGMLGSSLLEGRELRKAYDASVQGWDARAFHRAVDRQGPVVILARTASGALVGGYNPKGYAGLGGARPSTDAFLFVWPSGLLPQTAGVWATLAVAAAQLQLPPDLASAIEAVGALVPSPISLDGVQLAGYPLRLVLIAAVLAAVAAPALVAVGAASVWKPTQLPKVSGAGLAALDDPASGPCFGPDAFVVPLERTNPRVARSRLGAVYSLMPDGGNSIFASGSGTKTPASRSTTSRRYADEAQLLSLKALVGVYSRGERVPNSEAVNDFTSG